MASKSDSPTFPTPEHKELFTYGFPNLKWLKEMLFQDEPFDYILSRYCIFFKIILNFIQNSSQGILIKLSHLFFF